MAFLLPLRPLRLPVATLARTLHTTPVAYQTHDPKDPRPASSQLFPSSVITSSISHLVSQGYDLASIWEHRVSWGDHDAFAHVNNVHYLRWFESARMFFVETLTGDPERFSQKRRDEIIKGTGKSVILANVDIRFRRPVTYPDTILIAQAIEVPLGKDRFTVKAVAFSVKQQTVVALSNQACVTYDYEQLKKCDIPDDLKAALEEKGLSATK